MAAWLVTGFVLMSEPMLVSVVVSVVVSVAILVAVSAAAVVISSLPHADISKVITRVVMVDVKRFFRKRKFIIVAVHLRAICIRQQAASAVLILSAFKFGIKI